MSPESIAREIVTDRTDSPDFDAYGIRVAGKRLVNRDIQVPDKSK